MPYQSKGRSMQLKPIIIYKTKYGSSEQYASWIADALQCKAVKVEDVNLNDLLTYDVIVYVGGLYAGSVSGFKQIGKHLDVLQNKKLLLCMVGSTNPTEQEKYQQVFINNVPEQYRGIVKPFALRGNQLFSKMNVIHRIMMNIPKTMTEKIPVEQRTKDDKHFLEHYGEDVYFADRENIHDIMEYIKGLVI